MGLDGREWKSLLTLTTRPGTSWSSIMRAWSSLIRSLRKRYGDVQYAVAKEEGDSTGMRHLHAVLVGPTWVPHAVVSALWYRRLGAYIVDIRRVSGGKVAGYVGKYLTKQGLGLRKVLTYSRGWPKSKLPRLLECGPIGGKPVPRAWLYEQVGCMLVEWWGREGPCACCTPVEMPAPT